MILQKDVYCSQESNKIIILGNGGSAANAIHIAGDYMKTFSLLGLNQEFQHPLIICAF